MCKYLALLRWFMRLAVGLKRADERTTGAELLQVCYRAIATAAIKITRSGLKDIFGKEISLDLIERLHARELMLTGSRSPQRGSPYTFVTTEQFLVAFNLKSLQDLPNREQLEKSGLTR